MNLRTITVVVCEEQVGRGQKEAGGPVRKLMQ